MSCTETSDGFYAQLLVIRIPQLCFTVKLQNCSVDYDTSADFTSAWREEMTSGFSSLSELFL